jgi:ParB-like chromosome segregation protein Spo0J
MVVIGVMNWEGASMATAWATRHLAVATLHLDRKNPRLGRDAGAQSPRETIRYLFAQDKALDVAKSIATRGFFPNEPLLAVKEDGRYVVVEGNRRLAALKALREPALLEGPLVRQLARLAGRIADEDAIATVPVIVAPTREATDRLVAGRHVGASVLAWQAENRASFILEKLDEGYDNDRLRDELGFETPDIQKARQTKAIVDMARSLDLPDDVRSKLENPRAKLFTTIERVCDSTVGRSFLRVKPDPDTGLRGTTTQKEFLKGFTRLVTDVALGRKSSRSLNTNDNIRAYFESLDPSERAADAKGEFIPSDIVDKTPPGATAGTMNSPAPRKRTRKVSDTVLPKDFKVVHGCERLVDIREELVKLKRDEFPNAGAVLLRVFLELSILDYLGRTGGLAELTARLEKKGSLPAGGGDPSMKHLVTEAIKVAKARLPKTQAENVEKALKYDRAARFTISDFHSFVHQPGELPTGADLKQFWSRTEPLFRLMLERDVEKTPV